MFNLIYMAMINFLKAGKIVVLACLALLQFGCKNDKQPPASVYVSIKPEYGKTHLVIKPDSLTFSLPENAYNKIKSFNYFNQGAASFLSFYDRRSESVLIYEANNQRLVKQIFLKKTFNNQRFFKTSVYTISFDSILVTNVGDLYLLDSSGTIKSKIPFIQENESMAYYEMPVPVITKESKVFMGIRPFVSETKLAAIRNWKIMYSFDLNKKTAELCYRLPPMYRKDLYGRRFMYYSYCYNDKGNFVFSFPSDSCIYETDFADYHKSYYAKSLYQHEPVQPVNKEMLKKDEGGKAYALRDSYGIIFYDKYNSRYFRVVKHKIDKSAYDAGKFDRSYSIIVFDKHFKIIGEFPFNNDVSIDEMFSTSDGSMYARIIKKDETALHFVRLAWEEGSEQMPLTKK